MRPALCLVLLLAAPGCQKNATTPRGTEILSWTGARSARRSVAAAREIGPRAVKDVVVHARPERKGPVKLALHVETAPIELVEGGKTLRSTAPLAIRATVAQNPDWTLEATCGDGPHHRLPTIVEGSPVTPEEMVLQCNLGMRYEDTFNDLSYSVAIEISGDGAVKPSILGGTATLE